VKGPPNGAAFFTLPSTAGHLVVNSATETLGVVTDVRSSLVRHQPPEPSAGP
jgi:hypothetical protein